MKLDTASVKESFPLSWWLSLAGPARALACTKGRGSTFLVNRTCQQFGALALASDSHTGLGQPVGGVHERRWTAFAAIVGQQVDHRSASQEIDQRPCRLMFPLKILAAPALPPSLDSGRWDILMGSCGSKKRCRKSGAHRRPPASSLIKRAQCWQQVDHGFITCATAAADSQPSEPHGASGPSS